MGIAGDSNTSNNHHINILQNYIHNGDNGVTHNDDGSNSQKGATGMRWYNQQYGQIVVADNTVTTPMPTTKRYWDNIGGGHNKGSIGFPGPDSDVLRNYFRGAVDDCYEIEVGGRNVRVARNFSTDCAIMAAVATVDTGQLYFWRNVLGSSRYGYGSEPNMSGYLKADDDAKSGRSGPIYVYHNDFIGNANPHRWARTRYGVGWGGHVAHVISMNNIFHNEGRILRDDNCHSPSSISDYNLVWFGKIQSPGACGQPLDKHSIQGKPIFVSGPDWDPLPGSEAFYELDSSSRGYNEAIPIPGFSSARTDIGADESDGVGMIFGVAKPWKLKWPKIIASD